MTSARTARAPRIAVSILALGTVGAAWPLAAQAPSLVITGATVLDVETGRASAGQTVVVSGNRIVRVGRDAALQLPAGVRTLDARGKYVIPGLWDMHVHATGPVLDRLFLPVLAAHGVTGVRDMWGRFAWFDSVRAQVARGTLVAPRVVGSGHILDGAPAIWPGSTGVRDADEARRVVDSLAAGGAAFIKVYSRLSPDAFRAAAAQARARGLPFAGHVPSLVSVAEASDLGMRSIEHLQMLTQGCSRDEDALRAELAAAVATARAWDSASVVTRQQLRRTLDTYDAARCQALAARLRRNGTWMVPTLTVLRSVAFLDDTSLAADARLAWIPRWFSAAWNPRTDFRFRALGPQDWALRKELFAAQQRLVTLLHRAGVSFLAGTDLSNPYIFPGFSLHEELRNLVAAGFSPLEALRAATLNPARFLGAADSLGAVRQGFVADLVVLDDNPLADIANTERVHAVVLNGRLIDAAERQRLLEAGKALASGRP